MRSFAMKYEDYYACYNHGKSGKQRKRNKRLGKKMMRSKLDSETQEEVREM